MRGWSRRRRGLMKEVVKGAYEEWKMWAEEWWAIILGQRTEGTGGVAEAGKSMGQRALGWIWEWASASGIRQGRSRPNWKSARKACLDACGSWREPGRGEPGARGLRTDYLESGRGRVGWMWACAVWREGGDQRANFCGMVQSMRHSVPRACVGHLPSFSRRTQALINITFPWLSTWGSRGLGKTFAESQTADEKRSRPYTSGPSRGLSSRRRHRVQEMVGMIRS